MALTLEQHRVLCERARILREQCFQIKEGARDEYRQALKDENSAIVLVMDALGADRDALQIKELIESLCNRARRLHDLFKVMAAHIDTERAMYEEQLDARIKAEGETTLLKVKNAA